MKNTCSVRLFKVLKPISLSSCLLLYYISHLFSYIIELTIIVCLLALNEIEYNIIELYEIK